MKIISEIGIADFEAWLGAVETKQAIVDAGKEAEFESFIEGLWPDGLTDTELNDMLCLQDDWIFEALGISEDEE